MSFGQAGLAKADAPDPSILKGILSSVKTELVELSETKKSVAVEIPSDVVDAQIDRVARSYSRQARIPGFRQGKVPPTLIKKRVRDQILHDVAHDLIPRAIDEALRERGLEPVDTPDVKDVTLDEGQALTFTATFETLPPIDPVSRPSRRWCASTFSSVVLFVKAVAIASPSRSS